MSTELTNKEQIRLGRCMNIVGDSWVKSHSEAVDFNDEHVLIAFKREVINLYHLESAVEIELTLTKRGNEIIAEATKPVPTIETKATLKPFPV